MAIRLNLSSNDIYAPPGTYPITLKPSGEPVATGVIPPRAKGVSATVYGAGTVYLELLHMPSVKGGPDGGIVQFTDDKGDTTYYYSSIQAGHTSQTLTINVPTLAEHTKPKAYAFRLRAEETIYVEKVEII